MPPRYAYWTIIVDGQPTAFRAAMQEDLMPTFKRLKEKHPSAEMKWFQNGKLWASRLDAQEAMRERGERGRMGDKRQGGGFRERNKFAAEGRESRRSSRPASGGGERRDDGKLDWKPKGEFVPAPKRADRHDRSEWKPKEAGRKPFSKPGGFKSSRPPSRFQDRKPSHRDRGDKLEWKPKGAAPEPEPNRTKPGTGKREPGTRDRNWRPGGEHKDPRQKYKDAKKAKWSKFKANIRQRWEKKQSTRPPKKRRDEE